MKGNVYKSHKKISTSVSSSTKNKDQSTVESSKISKEEEENLKKFKMEEDYDMYEMEYDEE